MNKKKIKEVIMPQANIGKRFVSYLIDWYIGSLVCFIPMSVMMMMSTKSEEMTQTLFSFSGSDMYIAFGFTLVALCFYYIFVPVKIWKGQSFGKRMMKIKVVKLDGSEVDFKTMFIRQFLGAILIEGALFSVSRVVREFLVIITGIQQIDMIYFVSIAISIASGLLLAFSKKKNAIHDLLAKTKVEECVKSS